MTIRLSILLLAFLAMVSGCKGPKVIQEMSGMVEEGRKFVIDRKFFEANKEKILGNQDQALKLFKEVIDMDPNNAAAQYEAARIEAFKGDYITAVVRLKKAVNVNPRNKYYRIELAEILYEQKQYPRAIAQYQVLIELEPYNVSYYQRMLQIILADGDFDRALKTYNTMEERFGVQEEFSLQKQKIMAGKGDFQGAIAEMEKLIKNQPRNPKFYAILAELYKNSGDDQKALETYSKLEELEPENAFVQLSMAEYYSQNGDKEKAFESLKSAFANKSLDIDTKIRYLLKFYALSFQDTNLQDQSIELSLLTVKVHPEEPKAYAMLGDFYSKDSRYADAAKAYRNALKLEPNNFSVWSQLLFMDSQLNQRDTLIADCNKALEYFPNQGTLYFFKGGTLAEQKKYKESVKTLEAGLPLTGSNPQLKVQFLSSLGDSYYFLGQYAKSDKAYGDALEIDPDNVYILNNWSYFLSLRKEQLEKAESMSKICVKRQPDSPTYLDTHAWVLYQMGNVDEAKTYLEKALNSGGSGSSDILDHYGDVLFKLGDKPGAMKYWKQAFEVDPTNKEIEDKIERSSIED